MQSIKLILQTTLLCLVAGTGSLGGQERVPTSIDVVFVIDNSKSMRRSDPHRLMRSLVQTFGTKLADGSRLGIVVFDKDAELILGLTDVRAADFQSLINENLRHIDYRGRWTDFASGMERAIYELRDKGRRDAHQVIVLVTDGGMDVGNETRGTERARWLREDLAEDARRRGIRVFGVAISEVADFHLIRSIALTTQGEYFRAFGTADVEQIFEQVNARVNEPRQIVAESAVEVVNPPPLNSTQQSTHETGWAGLNIILINIAALSVLLAVVVVMLRRVKRNSSAEAANRRAADEVPSIAKLRAHGGQVSQTLLEASVMLSKTGTELKNFQTEVEDLVVSIWQAGEEEERRYLTMAHNLIQLKEYLELLGPDDLDAKSDTVKLILNRVDGMIRATRIESAEVTIGKPFDGLAQTVVGESESTLPAGSVLQVKRKGYVQKYKGRGERILRPAEVIVSNGRTPTSKV
jgi:molecular chaperone GrpE (heat shock protein)/uncharacterized protein YegL